MKHCEVQKIASNSKNRRNRAKKNKSNQDKKRKKLETEKKKVSIDFDHKVGNKQPLYELSMHEIKIIQKNNLHLTDYSRTYFPQKCNGISQTSYKIFQNGENIKKEFEYQRKKSSPVLFSLDKVKNNYITISVDIDDNMRNDSNIHIISNGKTGKALILVATLDRNTVIPVCIDAEAIEIFRQYKYNIASNTKTTSHFGSEGNIYGTGLVAEYCMHQKLSFGEYANKNKNGCWSDELFMKNTINTCMTNAIQSFKKIIQNVDQWFFLLSSVVHEKILDQKANMPRNMTKDDIPIYLSCQLNVNATTKYSHTEKDSSYTIIHVPDQSTTHNSFYFYFQISKNEDLQINMQPHMSMSYSSYLLTHSQRKQKLNDSTKENKSKKEDIMSFINISSYFSKRLYNNITASLHR